MPYAVHQFSVVDDAGDVVASPMIEIRDESSGSLATLYEDRDGVTPLSNPFTGDSEGFAQFFVAGGAYKVRAYTGSSGSPTFEKIHRYVAIGTAGETDVTDLAAAMGLGTAALADVGTSSGDVPDADDVLTSTPRIVTMADTATTTFDADDGRTQIARLTATDNRTVILPTNPVDGQKVVIEHIASGGARTLALDTGSPPAFRFTADVTALSATSSGKRDRIGVIYVAADAVWDVVAYSKG